MNDANRIDLFSLRDRNKFLLSSFRKKEKKMKTSSQKKRKVRIFFLFLSPFSCQRYLSIHGCASAEVNFSDWPNSILLAKKRENFSPPQSRSCHRGRGRERKKEKSGFISFWYIFSDRERGGVILEIGARDSFDQFTTLFLFLEMSQRRGVLVLCGDFM